MLLKEALKWCNSQPNLCQIITHKAALIACRVGSVFKFLINTGNELTRASGFVDKPICCDKTNLFTILMKW